jgi:hypothetical protein
MPPKKKTSRKVRVRTYRHGLGDCHLLSFTKPGGSFFHLLIDCGVVDVTENPGPLMTKVAKDIAKETGGTLDVVVATHQHTDHLSGFEQARAEFLQMTMKRLWFAWTEEKGKPLPKKIQDELLKKLAAVRAAVAQLQGLNKEAAARIQGVIDFFGPPGVAGQETQEILDWLRTRSQTTPEYYHPGNVFLLPEVPNVRVYVLGPPKKASDYRVMDPRKSKHEGYEFPVAADADGFADALAPAAGDRDPELSYPFERRHRRTRAEAETDSFFKQRYFHKDEAWRRIDTAWLELAEQLALYLDDFTNNSSLALAFEFIDTGEVLLFPGDAQIGSWLTWHKLEWTVPQPDGSTRKVRTSDLFAKTVFYKGSHHASHNGTLSGLGADQTGLEQMTHRDLICVVPVDRAMSKKKRWDRTLPWTPLLNRLAEKTRGRLVLTDVNEIPPDAQNLPLLSVAEQKKFKKQMTVKPDWVDYVL